MEEVITRRGDICIWNILIRVFVGGIMAAVMRIAVERKILR
jgi:hypothetical protein